MITPDKIATHSLCTHIQLFSRVVTQGAKSMALVGQFGSDDSTLTANISASEAFPGSPGMSLPGRKRSLMGKYSRNLGRTAGNASQACLIGRVIHS